MDGLKVKLGGHEWTVNFVTRQEMPKKTWGDTDWEKKTIRIRWDLSEKNFLDTALHEFRHALHPILFHAEGWIEETSTELAEALLATGLISVRLNAAKTKCRKA